MPNSINSEISLKGLSSNCRAKSLTTIGGFAWIIFSALPLASSLDSLSSDVSASEGLAFGGTGIGLGELARFTGGGIFGGAAGDTLLPILASSFMARSLLISSVDFMIAPSGNPAFFGASLTSGAGAVSTSLGSSTAFFLANSSTKDSAEILSIVLDELLTSKPRLRNNSINSLFSIPICFDS